MTLVADRARMAGAQAPPPLPGSFAGRAALLLLVLYAAVALGFRAPGLLSYDLNMDESLYRLIGRSLAEGHAPYTEFWDRKPVGTFLITALIHLGFGDSLAAFRLVTSLFVAATAWLLALVGRRLFPTMPAAGVIAGFLYIVWSVRNGGEGTNTELFFAPLGLAGLLCLLRAARQDGGAQARAGLFAGLLFGCAVQIKQLVVFDMLAYLAMVLLVVPDRFRRPALRRNAALAVAVGLGTVLPTLVILLWYLLIGQIGAWLDANIGATSGLVAGQDAPAFNLAGLAGGLRDFDLLVLGTAATLLIGPVLPAARGEGRSFAILACWLGAMALSLLFSRRFADHFFLQALPALAMATGFGMMLAARTVAMLMPAAARWTTPGLLACILLAGAWSGARFFHGAAEMLWRRHVDGIAHWGDRTATLGAAIGSRVQGPHDVYIFGRWLGLHEATGTVPPTRFPFALHLVAGYAPVDGKAELARILDTAPRFVVVESRWLAEAPGRPAAAAEVFDLLRRRLDRDYVMDTEVRRFVSWGGGTVGGAVEATLFRRRDTPEGQPPRGVHATDHGAD